MGISKIRIFLIGLLFFSEAILAFFTSENDCSTSLGGNCSPVRFPFKFVYQTRKDCGYPGFDLGCSSDDILSLNLPYSGEFLVRDINYVAQEIQLYDPNDCLPRRLLNLNLSSSPFSGIHYNNYTVLGCPPDIDGYLFEVIHCLSNSTISIVASSNMALVRELSNMCSVIATVLVPTFWSFQSNGVIGFSSNFSTGVLYLSWEEPDCRICEARGGSCGFFSNSSLETVCTLPTTPPPRNGGLQEKLLKIIGYSIFLPLGILPGLFVCIICLKCFLVREQLRLGEGDINNHAPSNPSRFSAMIQRSSNVKAGLDDSIIEAYPKVILDENCSNIAGDLICWICLEEYHSNETLRCLPNCKHYFHIECIDKWLKINGTCPVCRTSP